MQIHELNNYSGSLGDAYLVADNGSDTGKMKTTDLTDPLNARIDNIISGPAPSAAEIIDARQGADGIIYNSLGQAIRSQFGEIDEKFPISPDMTNFFDHVNYGIPANVVYSHNWVNLSGVLQSADSTSHMIRFKAKANTKLYLFAPASNRQIVICSSGDFIAGNTYEVLPFTVEGIYNGAQILSVNVSDKDSIGWYFYSGTFDYESNKNDFIILANKWNPDINPVINSDFLPKDDIIIAPKDTTFFAAVNYFDPETAVFYSDRFVDGTGRVLTASQVGMLVIPARPNTNYYFFAPNYNRGIVVESEDNDFEIGKNKTPILTTGSVFPNPLAFTTGDSAKYIGVYFSSQTYNYEDNKNGIFLNADQYYGDVESFIPYKYLPKNISVLNGAQVLIFGDSITDCCNIGINSSNETISYAWANPSNSYIDADGNQVNYSMWAKILKDSEPCGEIRNYALFGASYKSAPREAGKERQNLQYQINVALNDVDNPNGVFSVNEFSPDIVIFALGTNDVVPNDTYNTAMAKTVYLSDGVSIDVDSTIAALDDTKFCESARLAFMRIKKAFPFAQIYCVLPIQRADNDNPIGTLGEYLKQMAQRYGCIIVDGAFDTGITRDFNEWQSLGTYLKDGLHPNEKGQNLLARAIISSLRRNYIPFGAGYND